MRALPVLPLLLLVACDANIFTIRDDLKLGRELKREIAGNPDEYPPVDPEAFPEAYAHLDRIAAEVLASPEMDHLDDLAWEFQLIDDDDTLNAFAAPGGFVWVYTGLIRFLEEEDELAGVLAHEVAHADQRHSTEQLTKIYGISALISIVLGRDPGLLAEIAAGLVSLEFSRDHEREADEYSVRYLCDSAYAADGAAGFFEKLAGEGEIPEFLSTHPSSESRVEDIHALAAELGCNVEPSGNDYQAVIDSLP